jgi:hypothetical protein
MSMYVHYRVPLMVEVELATDEVLSVHINDEAIEGPLEVTTTTGSTPSPKKRRLAIDVAETNVWPSWTAGW